MEKMEMQSYNGLGGDRQLRLPCDQRGVKDLMLRVGGGVKVTLSWDHRLATTPHRPQQYKNEVAFSTSETLPV